MEKKIVTTLLMLVWITAVQAQLMIGGRQASYDRLTSTYLITVPESNFNQDITLAVSKDDNCRQIIINGRNVENNSFTFQNISSNNYFTVTFIQNNGLADSRFIKFTFLPIIQLNGSFGYDYQDGTMLLYEPDKAYADTLQASINWRGSTTNTPDKHKRNYKIKLKEDRKLLGMRNDNNWILDAGQPDVFRLRNRVAMDIWSDMAPPLYYAQQEPKARSAISGRVVEVFLNDEYMGIYNFSENMDRKQMKVKKIDAEGNIRGCLYKAKGWGYPLMYDTLYVPTNNLSEQWDHFEVKYPDLADSDTTDWTTLYNAIDFVVMSSEQDFRDHVAEYFDIPALVDYCIFGSALNAIDNYGKNIYWAVYDKTVDKKLTLAAWDLDCTVGQRWASQFNPDFISPHFLFDMTFGLTKRLIQLDVDNFVDKLNTRYAELRKGILATDSLQHRYQYYYDLITRSGAAKRETTRWSGDSDLNGELMSFDYEISYIKSWLTRHLRDLDREGFPLSEQVIPEAITPLVESPVRRDDIIYDLTGRRVSPASMSKGIYIINGKKVAYR